MLAGRRLKERVLIRVDLSAGVGWAPVVFAVGAMALTRREGFSFGPSRLLMLLPSIVKVHDPAIRSRLH